jgi:hypothetical protein
MEVSCTEPLSVRSWLDQGSGLRHAQMWTGSYKPLHVRHPHQQRCSLLWGIRCASANVIYLKLELLSTRGDGTPDVETKRGPVEGILDGGLMLPTMPLHIYPL